MKRKSLIVLTVLFLFSYHAHGTIYFNDGQTHNIDYFIGDDVFVDYQTPEMYTTANCMDGATVRNFVGFENSRINVSGGSIDGLDTFDSSQTNISGGLINGVSTAYDSSQVNITGGSIYDFYVRDSSQINISGGYVQGLVSYENSQANIYGGSIDTVVTFDSSKGDIYDGTIGVLVAFQYSQVNMSAGSVDGLLISYGSSQVNITGGLIGDDVELYDQSLIRIFGYDFAVDGQAVGYGELTSIYGGDISIEPLRHLTGTLLSGEFIDNDFYISNNARIILIPEPTTILLLGIGGLLLRKRK